ncbi:hypothetical protein ACN5W3_003688 [Vibrio parahaemolyticus]|nr:hypothetical protein D5E75_19810 [Vibrio parahaemolyticus]
MSDDINVSIFPMKLRGNIKRIEELADRGHKECGIAGTFQDNGINISPMLVKAVLNGELNELDRVALPKSVVEDIGDISDFEWD